MNCHNRLITIKTPNLGDNFNHSSNEIPINDKTEVLSSDYIYMSPKDYNSLKKSETSNVYTTFIVNNVPDDVPMDKIPYADNIDPIVVEKTVSKPKDMPMIIGDKVINTPQPNMLPSIEEYDDDIDDNNPCDNCKFCNTNMCDKCDKSIIGNFPPYDTDEEIYPQVVAMTDHIVDTAGAAFNIDFNRIRNKNNDFADVMAKRFGKVMEESMKDIINTILEVKSLEVKACQADDRALMSKLIKRN